MKALFSTLLLLLGLNTFAQDAQPKGGVEWISVNELEAKMKEEPRKVLIDVYTKWCGPCKMMLANTFTDKNVVDIVNEKFYAVKFNAEGNEQVKFKGYDFTNAEYDPNKSGRNSTHDFTLAIAPVNGRIAYPTIVYLNEKLEIIFPAQGYFQPAQYVPLLSYISSESYNTMTFEDYQAKASN